MSRPLFWWGDRLCTYGQYLQIGDDLIYGRQPHRIVRFEDYDPTRIGLPAEEGWRIAYSGAGYLEGGITVSPRGYYEIVPRPGEKTPRKIPQEGTWGVRYTDPAGERQTMWILVSEELAHAMKEDMENDASGDFRDVEPFDRLADLQQRFPADAEVVHTAAPELGVGMVTGGHKMREHYGCGQYDGDQVDVNFPARTVTATWLVCYLARVDQQ